MKQDKSVHSTTNMNFSLLDSGSTGNPNAFWVKYRIKNKLKNKLEDQPDIHFGYIDYCHGDRMR